MTRAKPFSGKKKREQQRAKKERKRAQAQKEEQEGWGQQWEKVGIKNLRVDSGDEADESDLGSSSTTPVVPHKTVSHLLPSQQTSINRGGRLVTIFARESDEEIARRKLDAHRPLDISLRSRPWDIVDTLIGGKDGMETETIDIPKRPHWDYGLDPQELARREQAVYDKWIKEVKTPEREGRLNYFEHNLDVWRQLWRVIEKSDILLLITDARYPLFHFSIPLYKYVTEEVGKPIVLILNKADLVDKNIVDAWENWFAEKYPLMKVVKFCSFRGMGSSEDVPPGTTDKGDKRRRSYRGRKRYESASGKETLLETVKSFGIKKEGKVVEISTKELNILSDDDVSEEDEEDESDSNQESDEDDSDEDSEEIEGEEENQEESEEIESNSTGIEADRDESSQQESLNTRKPPFVNTQKKEVTTMENEGEEMRKDIIWVGTVGHPNVGKSSLINGLMGKKVVSTSRTPGHTKHFQTIILAKNVVLVDCPGLVFPALDRPKAMQILCGLFPIAQVREPFSSIRYLAERVPVEKIYKLQPVDGLPWSPYTLCEALARKKGFMLAKSGRPDVHRVGLQILKDTVDGNIVISWPPPGYRVPLSQTTATSTTTDTDDKSEGEEEEAAQGDEDDETEIVLSKKEKKKLQKKKQKQAILTEDMVEAEKKRKDEKNKAPQPVQHSSVNFSQVQADAKKPKKGKKVNEKALEYAEKLAEKQIRGRVSEHQK